MPNIRYHTLNGRIATTTAPNVVRTTLPDALGSVVGTYNEAGGGRTTRFASYGSQIYTSGAWDLPRNAWVGSYGYRTTQMKHAEQYVRARHYSSTAGVWTTRDPLWPDESAYGYTGGSPATLFDRLGLIPQPQGCDFVGQAVLTLAMKAFCGALKDQTFRSCISNCAVQAWGPRAVPATLLECMDGWCKQGAIRCSKCVGRRKGECANAPAGAGHTCEISVCPDYILGRNGCGSGSMNPFGMLSHEIGHCCTSDSTDDDPGALSPGGLCNYIQSNCISSCKPPAHWKPSVLQVIK